MASGTGGWNAGAYGDDGWNDGIILKIIMRGGQIYLPFFFKLIDLLD